LSNYLIFDKQFITYIVILYNHNSFTEIKKKLTLELVFKSLKVLDSVLVIPYDVCFVCYCC